MKVLDCTLRDGGYYNKWDFERDVIKEYLASVSEAGIDYVELGLRNFPKNEFLGAFAYTTEAFLNSIFLPEGPSYGVMVDAKTLLEAKVEPLSALHKLFVPKKESKISLVRIAAHFHEVESCGDLVIELKKLGYIVGFNLMQSGGKSNDIISQKAKIINSWNALDVLYFADSLGNMDDAEVTRIVKALKCYWKGELGIHTHDNMANGLSNSMTALANGVAWLDSTITGMGRGAGNTQTEYLIPTLSKAHGIDKYNPKPIFNIVIKYFEQMQKNYGWGANLSYFLAASNGIHPTYIQNMLSNSHYQSEEVIAAIQYLISLNGTEKYSSEILNKALSINGSELPVSGSYDILDKFSQKEVLVIAGGPSSGKYASDIEAYINAKNPVVIAVNLIDEINSELIDYYCVTHNTRYLSESDKYKSLNRPLIVPSHRFQKEELSNLDEFIDYGLELGSSFSSHDTYCTLHKELTLGYAIAVATAGNADAINIVGIDGYSANDRRQQDMIELFTQLQNEVNIEICALTPTNYPIKKSSIYALV